MDKDAAKALIGFVFLPIVGVCLLLVGWGENDQPIYTLLGFAVLVVAVIIAAMNSKIRTHSWKDWFPF